MITEELSTQPETRLRRLWWLLPVALLVVVIAVVVLHKKAPPFPSLGWGNVANDAELYPGLPGGKGIHPVNTVGALHYDIYIPPQAGVFSLMVTIANTGSRAVVIESVKLPWHAIVWSAGPVRYSRPPGAWALLSRR